ncbi:MAG: hypothetical protein HY264_01430 [Chloroflexi bacterium]|nr:hypothetical protein [Chloroflexota bacterium]
MADRTLVVTEEAVAVIDRILRRSIAADAIEIRRLTTLGSAYFDRPAGRDVDRELTATKLQREVAEDLLRQLGR